MGKRGPLPQPNPQGHRKRADLAIVQPPTDDDVDIPPAPSGLLKITRDRWDAYWKSSVAQVAEECDLPAIHRLFRNYDQHERAMKVVRKALAVKGSRGQIRVNPVAGYALQLEQQILRLENELGLTPMARQRLGLTAAQTQLTVAQMNALVGASDPPAEGDVIDVDAYDEADLEGWQEA